MRKFLLFFFICRVCIGGGFATISPPTPIKVAGFNGTSSFCDFGSAFNFEYNQPFSVNVWIRMGDYTGDTQHLIGNFSAIQNGPNRATDYSLYRGWRILLQYLGPVNIGFQLASDITHWTMINSVYGVVPQYTWEMVSATSDGSGKQSGLRVYAQAVNYPDSGSSTDNLQGNSILSGVTAWLGDLEHYDRPPGQPGTGHYWYSGQIANLTIWSGVLSQTDVSKLLGVGLFGDPRSIQTSATLLDYFRMNGDFSDLVGGNNGAGTDVSFALKTP